MRLACYLMLPMTAPGIDWTSNVSMPASAAAAPRGGNAAARPPSKRGSLCVADKASGAQHTIRPRPNSEREDRGRFDKQYSE